MVHDDKAEIRGTIDLSNAEWLRSSQAEDPADGHLEIAFVSDHIAMRNSADPDGPVLIFTQAEWDAFVLGAQDGEFDDLEADLEADPEAEADPDAPGDATPPAGTGA